jgi:hypothetical protein
MSDDGLFCNVREQKRAQKSPSPLNTRWTHDEGQGLLEGVGVT